MWYPAVARPVSGGCQIRTCQVLDEPAFDGPVEQTSAAELL